MNFIGTVFSLLPPLVAIAFALKTKEVYLSLFIGIFTGALLYCGLNIPGAVLEIFNTMIEVLGKEWNVGILIFLVFLGIIVSLINKAGGSLAYGKWASKTIKSKKGALLSTFSLGAIIFVDDYFNCLTVGSVMKEVSDNFKISRAKLAYIIDSTAAPICIIAPVSSWAAAVAGYTSGDGFSLFLSTIPFNLYALLTIVMVLLVIKYDINIGSMKLNEEMAQNGDVTGGYEDYNDQGETVNTNGRVSDLVIPIIFLIISCICGMLYTGGILDGADFIEAFANCNASFGLVLGSFVTLVFIFILYIPRKIITYEDFANCIPFGFKTMVPAIIILILAWTLGNIVSSKLLAGVFVKGLLNQFSFSFAILPSVLFLVGAFLAFSTGTSWGTFGILIPIVTEVFAEGDPMLVITIAAILAGAVCGDHISPISDTTIMASAGAKCNHINHVESQTPYALLVACACTVGYLVAGFTQSILLTLTGALISLLLIVFIYQRFEKN